MSIIEICGVYLVSLVLIVVCIIMSRVKINLYLYDIYCNLILGFFSKLMKINK